MSGSHVFTHEKSASGREKGTLQYMIVQHILIGIEIFPTVSQETKSVAWLLLSPASCLLNRQRDNKAYLTLGPV